MRIKSEPFACGQDTMLGLMSTEVPLTGSGEQDKIDIHEENART